MQALPNYSSIATMRNLTNGHPSENLGNLGSLGKSSLFRDQGVRVPNVGLVELVMLLGQNFPAKSEARPDVGPVDREEDDQENARPA